jgi:hypothetical protein
MKWKLPVLISYIYYDKNVDEIYYANREKLLVLMDSGAFTAFRHGRVITIDEYADFLSGDFMQCIKRYFTLDIIGDPKGTRENYDELLKRGFHPIPIFTRGDNLASLDYYYTTHYLVGIGGLVYKEEARGGLKWLHNLISMKDPHRKVHWLGFALDDFILHYKPFSCDTSTWVNGTRFGRLILYTSMGMVRFERDAFLANCNKLLIKTSISNLGYSIHDLKMEKNWHGHTSILQNINVDSYIMWSYQLRKRIGTTYYMAVSQADQIGLFVKGYNRLLNIGQTFEM